MARSLVQTSLFVVVLASLSLPLASAALAQDQNGGAAVFTAQPEPQNASNHPLSVYVAIGPEVRIDNSYGRGIGAAWFKGTQGIDYHFSGTDEGFHVGLMISEGFNDPVFLFQASPRAGWDLKFALGSSGLFLGVDPFLALGFSLYAGGGNSYGYFDIEPGVDVKLYFGDMFYAMVRPVAFEIFAGDLGGVSYDLLFGAGARF